MFYSQIYIIPTYDKMVKIYWNFQKRAKTYVRNLRINAAFMQAENGMFAKLGQSEENKVQIEVHD